MAVVSLHVILLPLTLTFGAGIKTLIDFFSRKNIPEEIINDVNIKIESLDDERIMPLIRQVTTSYIDAQSQSHSKSSMKLFSMLVGVEHERDSTKLIMQKAIDVKKRALQEAILKIDQCPSVRSMYREDFIASLPLDEERQRILDEYITSQVEQNIAPQLRRQKDAIREYLVADHNHGKRTQQVICNYFFPPTVAPQKNDGVIPPAQGPICG